jgi:HPt (histidine-containing phosphotransfer) domain-containing protein
MTARLQVRALEGASYPQTEAQERPLDLVRLAHQSHGNAELERELLSLFDRQATQILGQLRNSQSRALQRDLARTLGASARAVGASGVAAAAQTFEGLADSPVNEKALAQGLADLEAAVRAATNAIKALLA